QMAEERLFEAGNGTPPVPYSVLVMGSAGRGESLLAADQDNAIVFQSGEPGGTEDQWFESLAVHMADILDEVGVPYCQGGVMAKNALWRQSVSGWQTTIDTWVGRQRPEDLLNVDIFYDAVPVHGDFALGRSVWSYAYDQGAKAPAFIRMLSEHIRDWRPPLTLFGNLRLMDNGRIDLKKNGLFPIVTAARVLSIKNAAKVRSSPDRLNSLRAKGVGSPNDIEDVIDAHRTVVGALLAQQLVDSETGVPLSSNVDPRIRGKRAKASLGKALAAISTAIDLSREGAV
ncbi:MAG: DUF294 nucleotidyltransferase-like domain-containing protein, partial [Hyphomicrobiaceae bacterium]